MSDEPDRIAAFSEFRQRMNERILAEPNQVVRRFFALDTQTYQAGALDVKTKELCGLTASLVLRCDDCISYHVAQCRDAGVTREEMFEAFSVGLVVGGSIVIQHLRRAVDFLDKLEQGEAATPAVHDHGRMRGGIRERTPSAIIAGCISPPKPRGCAVFACLESTKMTTITVIRGDGIGPEIMDATLHVLDAMQLGLSYEYADAGMVALEKHGDLLPAATMDSIRKNRIALKSPLTTPVGEGFSSINVELRKRFDLYANVRPAKSFPNTKSRFPSGVDLITVRENTEGAYIGEGQQLSADGETATLTQKITRRGSERIVRYAFDLARKTGRKKVTVVHKANILKSTSGLFLKTAREVAQQYPDIQCNEMIVDNTCMQLVMKPEQFDIIVTTNLFGDIISDLCAGLVGGLGLAPGANIGTEAAIFEAVHGTAPDIAGQGKANPCALLLGAAQMLDHLGLPAKAEALRNAIIATLEAKDSLTPDLGGEGNTLSFAKAIASRV